MICVNCVHYKLHKCTLTNTMRGLFNECDCDKYKDKIVKEFQ